MIRSSVIAVMATLWASASLSLEFRVTVADYDSSRNYYEIGLLELALSKADGDHSLTIVDPPRNANQDRLIKLLQRGSNFDVMFVGVDQDVFQRLRIVSVPLYRGLLGHRILITNDAGVDILSEIQTIEELRDVTIGSGVGWPDTEILERAGFNVETASYNSLFEMVDRGRIPTYARGIMEPFGEVAARIDDMPNLRIDPTILIVYPFDVFFFVGPDDQQRAEILSQGLTRAYEDGSFIDYFNSHPSVRDAFLLGQPDNRLRFEIDNPLLPDEILQIPDRFWYSQ